jgi:hypothetical protein
MQPYRPAISTIPAADCVSAIGQFFVTDVKTDFRYAKRRNRQHRRECLSASLSYRCVSGWQFCSQIIHHNATHMSQLFIEVIRFMQIKSL